MEKKKPHMFLENMEVVKRLTRKDQALTQWESRDTQIVFMAGNTLQPHSGVVLIVCEFQY